jgi:hypothetical protein
MVIPRPNPDEYAEFYGSYIARVTEDQLLQRLHDQPKQLGYLLRDVSDEQVSARPAPDEWSIKEVIGHLNDAERVFSYRTLRFSRRDESPLPGFDQDDYVQNGNANLRMLNDLLEEFGHLRAANILLFKHLPAESLTLRGQASNHPVSVRALIYITVGHVEHHLESLRTVYLSRA